MIKTPISRFEELKLKRDAAAGINNACPSPSVYEGVIYNVLAEQLANSLREGAKLDEVAVRDIETICRARDFCTKHFGEDKDSYIAEAAAANISLKARISDSILHLFGLKCDDVENAYALSKGHMLLDYLKSHSRKFAYAIMIAAWLVYGGVSDFGAQNTLNIQAKPAVARETESAHTSMFANDRIKTSQNRYLRNTVVFLNRSGQMDFSEIGHTAQKNVNAQKRNENTDSFAKGYKIEKFLGVMNNRLSESQKKAYVKSVLKAADVYKLDPLLITGVIIKESTGNPNARSGAGAMGPMQVMWSVHGPSLNKRYGFTKATDLFDIENGVMAGSMVLKGYVERCGNLDRALSRYLGGPAGLYAKKIKSYMRAMNKITPPEDIYESRFQKDGELYGQELAETMLRGAWASQKLGGMNAKELAIWICADNPMIADWQAEKLTRVIMARSTNASKALFSQKDLAAIDKQLKEQGWDLKHEEDYVTAQAVKLMSSLAAADKADPHYKWQFDLTGKSYAFAGKYSNTQQMKVVIGSVAHELQKMSDVAVTKRAMAELENQISMRRDIYCKNIN